MRKKLKKGVAGVILTAMSTCIFAFPGEMVKAITNNSYIQAASLDTKQTQADDVSMDDFLEAYGNEDFDTAEQIGKKLENVNVSLNSNMSSSVKKAYLNQILKTKNMDSYYLSDLTGDEIPELIVKTGTCEADYELVYYTYSKSTTKKLGITTGGHSFLAHWPEKNGVIRISAHMGSEALYAVVYEDGKLTESLVGDRDCSLIDYTPIPYTEYGYVCCYRYDCDLSPFSDEVSTSLTTAKKKIKKVTNRINSVLYIMTAKKGTLKLDNRAKVVLAGINTYLHNRNLKYKDEYAILPKAAVAKEYKKLFGTTPKYSALKKKIAYYNSETTVDDMVFRDAKGKLYSVAGDYGTCEPNDTKIKCIQKISGGYRVVAALRCKDYENNGAINTYNVVAITLKKSSKATYGYWITSINFLG